jgi:hypothetical protein
MTVELPSYPEDLCRSRVPVNTEWELHPAIFQAITLIWDRPLIDLFATSLNYKLETFVSTFKGRRSGFAHDNSRRSGNQDCLGQAGAIRMVLQPSSLILWRRRKRTHKSSGNEGSSTVIETLPRSDSKTVSVDSHRQYNSGGLSSESRGNSLLFSVDSRGFRGTPVKRLDLCNNN